jgi:hypothetical protein
VLNSRQDHFRLRTSSWNFLNPGNRSLQLISG